MQRLCIAGTLWFAALTAHLHAADTTTEQLLGKIKSVGPEGLGNPEAAGAWKELVSKGEHAFFPTLAAMDNANPIALNWLRTAAEAIFQNCTRAKTPIPAAELEAFVKDTRHAPPARRIAYESLAAVDAKAPARLLPGMLEDPSIDIRRDAIAAAIEKAEPLLKKEPDAAKEAFQKLFVVSRDLDQAESIAKKLKGLNAVADLSSHFGVVSHWHVIGPFDSTMGAGFGKAFDPEAKVDLGAAIPGKAGKPLKWVEYTSTDPYGMVDLNKALGKFKDAVAYGYAAVESDRERLVEIRFGCIDAIKVFVNGKEIFAREEYHHGQRFDQYVSLAKLKPGKNELLVKVCQNNQSEPWAQDWKFQLRICDSLGGAVPVKVVGDSR